MTPEALAAAVSGALVRTAPFGTSIHHFTEVTSTNDLAMSLAERGAAEGTLVLATAQTAGRGRQGREWFSPPGAGLYVSVVCRNRQAAPLLTLAAGVGVAEGVRAATGLPVEIKWPNDIVVRTGAGPTRWRKLAGILAEGSSGTEGLQYVVVGIGVNLRPAAYPPAIADRASSIETELGRAADPGAVLVELLAAFAASFRDLGSGRRSEVLDRWRALSPSASGARVSWETESGRREGVTSGIDDEGALLVTTTHGISRLVSGEISWRV